MTAVSASSCRVAAGGEDRSIIAWPAPLPLNELIPGIGAWEVEIGFGKGRYLLRRAAEEPDRRFLGIEVAGAYYRLARDRAHRRELRNLVLIRGEAIYLLSAILPVAFAGAVHIYFPDPWPKARHQRRRLFAPESVDLVLGLLAPGGTLSFATDFTEYGELVSELLEEHPCLAVRRFEEPWPEGPRTNYEAKYVVEGRPIVRLEAQLLEGSGAELVHPRGASAVTVAAATE